MKEAGAPRNIDDLLAEKLVGIIFRKSTLTDDFDEACQLGGVSFKEYLDALVESPEFQTKVRKLIGSKYNEEFFLDGYRLIK